MGHLHEDDVHVPVFDGADFLATRDLAEHAALDGDALRPGNATTCYGLGVLVQTADDGEVALDTRNDVVTHMYSP